MKRLEIQQTYFTSKNRKAFLDGNKTKLYNLK